MLIVPARHGWLWVAWALRVLGKAPFAWILVSMAYWVVMGALSRLPYVGLAAGSLVTPAIAVSFLAVCRELDAGRPFAPRLVTAGFRRNLPALVTLGGLYLAATLAIFAATWPIDDGALARWMLFGKAAAPAEGQERAFVWAVAAAFALWVPVQLAFWFAPPLAAWDDMPAVKALFFSFFAALRNWAAFLVFAAVAGAATAAATALLFNLHRMQAGAVPTVLFLVLVAAIPLYYATLYASYQDVFPERPAAPER